MRKFLTSTLALVVLSPIAANADLIDLGDHTLDTETGLEWLDLTATIGLSRDFVASQLGVGGLFAGYDFVGIDDLETLAQAAGFSALGAVDGNADLLIDLLGATGTCGTGGPCAIGIFTNPDSFTGLGQAGPRGFGDFFVQAIFGAPNLSYVDKGHFLVRAAAVPEPGTLALLGAGLIGMGFARRRKAA